MSRLGASRLFAAASCLGLVLVAAPASGAAAQRCDALRGKSLISDARIKVVSQKVKDKRLKGTRVLGCALPRGKVFAVAERGTPRGGRYYNSVTYTLGEHAGTYLDVRRYYGDGAAQTQEESSGVLDLRTGQRRTYFTGTRGEGSCAGTGRDSANATPPLERLVLSAGGLFAALYASTPDSAACFPNDGEAVLLGFLINGERVALDVGPVADIPADGVRLAEDEFRWLSAGAERTAPGRLQ
jgi:hypothetical protein